MTTEMMHRDLAFVTANNLTFRTGKAWIPVTQRQPAFHSDWAAEEVIDATDWVPTGAIKGEERWGSLIIQGETTRNGTWG